MPSRDFVTFAAACNEAYGIFGGFAEGPLKWLTGVEQPCR
jgi:hypothetical protein